MTKNIFVTRKIPDIGIKMLEEKGYSLDINPKNYPLSQKEIIKYLKKKPYDAVLSLLTDKIDSKVFESAPSVKLYANYATGFDNVDINEAKIRGIAVTNSPGNLTAEAVAEHTIALMLALAARIVEADEFVRQKKYKGWEPMNFIGTDLLGKTLGLVGAGRIGDRVAFYAKGLGFKIIYTDVTRNERIEKDEDAVFCSSLDELLKQSDVVSLHVPLLDSTKHLINEEKFKIMKPTSFLINTSRGPVIDEKALEVALRNKIISAAAIDVFEFEPKITPGLLKLQNIILTPHIASASIEARNQMAEVTAQNIIDFFETGNPKNKVN
ncbi:MAG: D-glycerate dehydrogenase [bacterium]